jgi:hypothetical protein
MERSGETGAEVAAAAAGARGASCTADAVCAVRCFAGDAANCELRGACFKLAVCVGRNACRGSPGV